MRRTYAVICENTETAPQSVNSIKLDDNSEVSYSGVVLPVSAKCNLKCPYCFAQTETGFTFPDYTPESAEHIIDFIVSRTPDPTCRTVLYFFGGEPLLNFPIIKHIVGYIKKKYPMHNISYSATTNGTLLNRGILEFIQRNNIFLLFSIDGPDNEFNLRYYKNGRKSVYRVIKNIEYLKRYGIPLSIRSTMITDNPYICETYAFFEELEVPFTIKFAYPSENRTHTELNTFSNESLARVSKAYNELLEYYSERIRNKHPIYNQVLNTINRSIRYRYRRNTACTAGVKQFTITADGDIFTCPQLMNDKKFRIGNIASGMLSKTLYTATPVDDIAECKNCWARYLCSGGCPAQKVSSGFGNRRSLGREGCEAAKIEWEFVIKLYYHIVRQRPELLGRTAAGGCETGKP